MFDVTDHIDEATAKVRKLFVKASARIEALQPGEKIPGTKLADDIGEEIGESGAKLYSTLKILFDNYPGVVVKRGATGGIYRPLLTENLEELRAKAKPKKEA